MWCDKLSMLGRKRVKKLRKDATTTKMRVPAVNQTLFGGKLFCFTADEVWFKPCLSGAGHTQIHLLVLKLSLLSLLAKQSFSF